MSTNAQKDKLNSLISRREKFFDRMQKLYDYTKYLNATNKNAFLARFERIDEYYESFDRIQSEIDTLCNAMDPADKIDTAESTTSFEELYFDTKAFVRTHKLDQQPPADPAPAATPAVVHPKLPKLEVPIFSGDLKTWSNFHSLYQSTIHRRTDITEVEKLQYLRSFLRGPPLSLIENFQLLDGNYNAAYRLLCDRYENKRALASHHLNMILNFKPLHNSNVSGLKTFLDVFQTNFAALKNLGLPNFGDFLMVQIALRALNVEHKKIFEDKLGSNEIPTYEQLMTYVNKLCHDNDMINFSSCPSTSRSTNSTAPTSNDRSANNNSYKKNSTFQRHSYLSTSDSSQSQSNPHASCPLCKAPHPLFKCSSFHNLDISNRVEILKNNNRCFNCLGSHRITECRSNSTCQTCHKRHHTLIHRDSKFPSTSPTTSSAESSRNVSCHFSTGDNFKHTSVLLGTARASILDSFGNPHPIRLVVDPGSQISCITEACVQRIGLRRYKCGVSISGIGDNTVPENNGAVSCILSTHKPSAVNLHTEAVILKRISSTMPSVPISPQVLSKFSHLALADPGFCEPGVVDFLLGAELYSHILCTTGNNVIPGTPTAMRTTLGSIVFGRAPTYNEASSLSSFFVSSPSLDTILHKFWETEEVAVQLIKDPEDVRCEEHFLATDHREDSGRYVVALPFRDDVKKLGENRTKAYTQYLNLEKRLNKNENLKVEYNKFFDDYVEQDHMILCNTPSRYIIPHHAVLKQSSSTTKVRAVFNASASSSTQTSLNELLMKGPKLQKDISNIVLSFRSHCVVVCADIRQMYRQILLHPDDRKFQHIFWRNPNTNEVAEYELTTVTYGISPSAYQAQRVLQQLVHDEGESFPLASRAILNETYIDDIVSGAATQEEALQLQQELISLLKRGCFELRKWASNNAALLDNVPHDHREKPLALRDNEEPTFKILGLHWDPASDTFSYHVSDIDIVFTKRSILSHVARMFDPLGWLSPVIFWAKYLLQLLWLSQHSWDDPLSPALAESWSTFSSQLPQLQTLRIPRYVDTSAPHFVHIVGFCDASSKGYAAVIYLVSSNLNSPENKVYLLKGKSKVAPTKSPLSIPRLELCGALLLARLYDSLKTYFSTLQISSRTFYSDSNIVLAWIKTPPHTLKTYVANRIVEVNNLISDKCDWYHVPTDLNPADCASRGLLPVQFLEHSQWLHGPDFLRLSSEHWPQTQGNLVETLPELKENTKSLLTVNPPSKSYLLQCCEKYSKLTKLQRVFAYVLRFINNVRNVREQRSLGTLSVSELDNSLMTITKLEQQYHFDKVISALQSNSKITNSAILKLTPFLDEHGRLRVGGRLRNAKNLSQDSIHPLLLAKHCHLSKLLCDHYHVSSLHAGPRTVQALLQQTFWIISGAPHLYLYAGRQVITFKRATEGCTSPNTYEAVVPLLSQFTPLLELPVVDATQSIAFPMNVIALLPYMLLHYEDANELCIMSAENIAQLSAEKGKKLENLGTVMTLYSRRTFSKESFQWTKCVVKYLYDSYSHLSMTMLTFLVEVLEKGPSQMQLPVLNIIHCMLHYVDLNSSSHFNAELLRVIAKHIEGVNYKEALNILKLVVTRSSTLVTPPQLHHQYINWESHSTSSHSSFSEFKKELPGRTMEFTIDLSQTPVIGRKSVKPATSESEGSTSTIPASPRRSVSLSPGDGINITGWKRPWMSQSRVRECLVNVLTTCGQRVGLPKSPSVIFSQSSDLLERQSSMASSTEEVSGPDISGGTGSRPPHRDPADHFGVFKDFDFLEYESESVEGESTDNFNWGVRRRPLSEGDENPEPRSLLEESLSEKTPLLTMRKLGAGVIEESSDDEIGSESPLDEIPPVPEFSSASSVHHHHQPSTLSIRPRTTSDPRSDTSGSSTGDISELTPCNTSPNLAFRPILREDTEELFRLHIQSLLQQTPPSSLHLFHTLHRLIKDIVRKTVALTRDATHNLSELGSIASPLTSHFSSLVESLASLVADVPLIYFNPEVINLPPEPLKFGLLQMKEHTDTLLDRNDQAAECVDGLRAVLKLQTLGDEGGESGGGRSHEEPIVEVGRSLYKLYFQLMLLLESANKMIALVVNTARSSQLQDISSEVIIMRQSLLRAQEDMGIPTPTPQPPLPLGVTETEGVILEYLSQSKWGDALTFTRTHRNSCLSEAMLPSTTEDDDVTNLISLYCQQLLREKPDVFVVTEKDLGHVLSNLMEGLMQVLTAVSSIEGNVSTTSTKHSSHLSTRC
ncbi:hypothetical protein M8J77_023758 [Diaphorina citri]|nr:hypothetical protein M8J77_023758 [Diaphorina citri]